MWFIGMHRVEDVKLLCGSEHSHLFATAKVVYAQVVRDAHNPRQELSFFIILPTLQCIHHLDKGVLKQVVREIAVANDKENFRINLLLMAVQKTLERGLIPGLLPAASDATSERVAWCPDAPRRVVVDAQTAGREAEEAQRMGISTN